MNCRELPEVPPLTPHSLRPEIRSHVPTRATRACAQERRPKTLLINLPANCSGPPGTFDDNRAALVDMGQHLT